jgi:hypothetical protein
MVTHSCVLRVNRMFDGHIVASRSRTFTCNVGGQAMEVRRVTTEVAWRLGVGVACDESMPIVPNSFFGVRGTTSMRSDGFAHFSGRLTITDLAEDEPPVLLFVGRMDLIGRIGSHQFLGENCDEHEHYEGWLAASGRGPLEGHRMPCVVVGHGELPEGITANVSINRISGTLFLPA